MRRKLTALLVASLLLTVACAENQNDTPFQISVIPRS